MSLEYFEPRPPKSAAIKLDFLDDTDSSAVVSKLREVPGVYEVDIQHYDNGIRRVVINPRGSVPGVMKHGYWLVSTPESARSYVVEPHLELLSDTEFGERFRPCQPNVRMVVQSDSDEEHAVMPTGCVEYR